MTAMHLDEQAIFEVARKIDSREACEAYLQQVCGDDAALGQRVRALLKAYEESASFLESPAVERPSPLEAERLGAREMAATTDQPNTEGPGTVIGPYKLLEQIGEGGFGVVFMAEQTQPVRRKVALKVLKPGMDTRQVVARFEAERQALAIMDHPNIAKVLDAGATESGRPFFVMDLVKGVPIADFCDQNQLTPRQRLELFIPVCQAVQHAHQKGIIHRDLKPSNILVVMHDTTPVPKVIDFGIAKALGQELTDKTLFTGFAQMVGTPLYMSPEQAGQSGLDIDTRSDIYSLGVLLYELLTGTTPFDKDRFRQAAYDEIRRIIREEEPPRPSTRLSTTEELPSIAANRGVEPKRLSGLVRGELDWIVMKCLDKDRNRRYETANGLARDIEHYLHDEAVQACPPSAAYRFRKFARRNKAALVTASLLAGSLVVLVVGLALSNVWVIAERNEKTQALKDRETALVAARESAAKAEAESKRSKKNFLAARIAIREVITKAALGDGEWSQLPAPLRKKFTEESIKFYQGLIQDSSDPGDRYETALAYRAIGLLHGRAGEHDEAEHSYRESVRILDELSRASPEDIEYRYQFAYSHLSLASFLSSRSIAEANASFRTAAALFGHLCTEVPHSFDYRRGLADCLVGWVKLSGPVAIREAYGEYLESLPSSHQAQIGHSYRLVAFDLQQAGRLQESEEWLRLALEIFNMLTTEDPDSSKNWHYVADTYRRLGNVLNGRRTDEEVEQALRRAVEIHNEQVWRPIDWLTDWGEWAAAYSDLAGFLKARGRTHEAEGIYREAAEGTRELAVQYDKLAAESPAAGKYRFLQGNLELHAGGLLSQAGLTAEAEQAYRRSVAAFQAAAEQFPNELKYRHELGRSHNWLGRLLQGSGRLAEAAQEHRQAIELYTGLAELADAVSGHWHRRELAWSRMSLGHRLNDTGRTAEAESEFRSAVKLCEELEAEKPTDPTYRLWIGHALWGLGDASLQSECLDDAEQTYQRALEIFQKLHADYPANRFYMQEQGFSHRKLAGVAERAGRSEDAEHHLRQALGWYKKLVAKSPDSRNELAGTLAYLGLALEKAQRPHEAEEAYGKALALWKQLSDADPANEWYRQERAHFSVVLGNSLQAAGRPEEAIEYCSTCVRLNEQLVADFADKPHHRSRLAYGRGVFISLLSSLGHHEQVGNEIETVLKGSPSTEELNNIAWFLCSRSNPSAEGARQAVDLAQKAVELNRNAGHIWNTLGVAHYRAGSWPAAIEALQKARELNVDKHFSWDAFFLAMAYWQLDNPDQARKWFDHAVEWMEKNAKDNEELRRFRAEAEKLMKKE